MTTIHKEQTEKTLEILETLDIIIWYDSLEQEDFQVVEKAIAYCKTLISEIDGHQSIASDLMTSVEDLESVFFELSLAANFKEVAEIYTD